MNRLKLSIFLFLALAQLVYCAAIPSKALNIYALGFALLSTCTGFCAGFAAGGEAKND